MLGEIVGVGILFGHLARNIVLEEYTKAPILILLKRLLGPIQAIPVYPTQQIASPRTGFPLISLLCELIFHMNYTHYFALARNSSLRDS